MGGRLDHAPSSSAPALALHLEERAYGRAGALAQVQVGDDRAVARRVVRDRIPGGVAVVDH